MLPPNDPIAAINTNSRLIQSLTPEFQIDLSAQITIELILWHTRSPQ